MGKILYVGLLPSVSGAQLAHSVCQGQRSGLAVMLWLTVFLGIVVPLHVTAWYERRVKRRYIRLQRQAQVSAEASLLQRLAWLVLWAPTCCLMVVALMELDMFNAGQCRY